MDKCGNSQGFRLQEAELAAAKAPARLKLKGTAPCQAWDIQQTRQSFEEEIHKSCGASRVCRKAQKKCQGMSGQLLYWH